MYDVRNTDKTGTIGMDKHKNMCVSNSKPLSSLALYVNDSDPLWNIQVMQGKKVGGGSKHMKQFMHLFWQNGLVHCQKAAKN